MTDNNITITNITSFSDWNTPLDEYPKHLKGRRLHKWIIKNLSSRKRISVWEIDCDIRMLRTLMFLQKIKRIELDSSAHEYPYIGVKVL